MVPVGGRAQCEARGTGTWPRGAVCHEGLKPRVRGEGVGERAPEVLPTREVIIVGVFHGGLGPRDGAEAEVPVCCPGGGRGWGDWCRGGLHLAKIFMAFLWALEKRGPRRKVERLNPRRK